ncbi:MAG: hypothetical protein ACRC1Z_09850 [Waterburya sp.]
MTSSLNKLRASNPRGADFPASMVVPRTFVLRFDTSTGSTIG